MGLDGLMASVTNSSVAVFGSFAAISNTSLTALASADEKKWFVVGAVLCSLITVILIIFILANINCIKRLIAIIRECTKVFKSMMLIVVWRSSPWER
jgi:hypothetical protein